MADEPKDPPERKPAGPINGTPPGKGTVTPAHGGRIANPPHQYSEDIAREVRTMAKVANQRTIAKALKMSRSTLQTYYHEAWDEGRTEAILTVGGKLLQKALNGDLVAQIFWLKTQAKEDYSQRVEHTGAGGGPIQTEEVRRRVEVMTDEQLAAYKQLCLATSGMPTDDDEPAPVLN